MFLPRPPCLTLLLLRTLLLLHHCLAYTLLSNDSLLQLSRASASAAITDFDIHNTADGILAPILQPRVPGTAGSVAVLTHFQRFFQTNLPGWTVTLQNSTARTPGAPRDVPFVNLIATRDPPRARGPGHVGRLALVAHYDSKLTPEGFVGATDSAAPCAMILHVARALDEVLTRKWAARTKEMDDKEWEDLEEEDEKGVQIILLDGEEAFMSWTDQDSLYGARYVSLSLCFLFLEEKTPPMEINLKNHQNYPSSLAETWEHTYHPALSTYPTALSSINLFVLLDLLGAPGPSVPSYFRTTHWAYKHLAVLEARHRALKLFRSSPNYHRNNNNNNNTTTTPPAEGDDEKKREEKEEEEEPIFLPDLHKHDTNPHQLHYRFTIQDDHIPFLARGVEVLHLIPSPFPTVWHLLTDDGDHLDLPTVGDWASLMTAFVAEWMDLDPFLRAEEEGKEQGEGEGSDGDVAPPAALHKRQPPAESKTEL